ncbi:restriction endonuclease subunit S, partial [Sutterella wadsworthensis]
MTMPKLRFKSNELLREVSLSEVGNFYGGLSGKTKSDFGFGDSKFITYMNVFTNTIAKQDMCDLVMVGHNEKQNLVVDGDVLFTQSSETPEEVGMASVWTHKQKVYLNSFSFGLRIKNKQNVDPVYLTYLLRSPVYRKSISIQAQGISRYNLSSSRLSTLKVKIPALEEQQKIAAFFTALDRRIENCEKRLVTLEHLKKGLLQKMLSSNSRTLPEIRFKGFAGSWKAYKLSEVLDEIYVGQTPRRNHKEFWNGAINWLSSRDLTRGFVEETAEKITDVGMKSTRLRIVPYGTVVIAMIGLDAENTRG